MPIYSKEEGKKLDEKDWLPTGQIVDQVTDLLKQFKTEIPVTIIDNDGDVLPASAVGDDGGATMGFVYRGRIHIVRSGVATPEAVTSTLFHELLHFGIRRFVPEKEYIAQMRELYRADPWIAAKTEAWLDSADGLATAKKYGDEIAAARGVDEALAELAEELHAERTAPGVKIGSQLAKAAQNVISWLKKMAQMFGWKPVVERLNDLQPGQQSKDYVESIFKRLREGDNPPFVMTSKWAYSDPAFSRQASPVESPSGATGNTIEVDGKMRPTTNSNGKPIAQTEEGLRNFWRWFAGSKVVDAEGRPLVVYHGTAKDFTKFDLSKSGESTGNTGFYGAGAYFSEDGEDAGGYALWARKDDDDAANVIPAYLSLKDPLYLHINPKDDARKDKARASLGRIVDQLLSEGYFGKNPDKNESGSLYARLTAFVDKADFERFMGTLYNELKGGEGVSNLARRAGFDGVMAEGFKRGENFLAEAVAFNTTQIKSATGNRGTFDKDSANILFAKDAKSTSVSPADIRAALVGRFGERGIKALESSGLLKIVRIKDAPEAMREEAMAQGASALYSADGVAYLFSDRMTAEDAPGKLLHEIGEHYGLERMLGADGWGRMKKRIVAMAKAKGSVAYGAWEGVKANYTEFANKSDSELAGNERFLHEVLAAIGENKAGMQTSLWREMLAAVKEWLASKGLLVDWINEGDIANLVSGSLKKAMRDAEAGLVAPEKMESLVETYFRQIVSAMKAADQLIEDCA